MASNYSQLGILGQEKGDLIEAIGLHLRAAVLRAQLKIPQLAFDIQQLQALRDKVGHDEFAEQAAQILTSDQLLPILDLMNNAEA